MHSNLFDVLLSGRSRAGGNNVIALTVEDGTTWTYAALDAASANLAGVLRDAGVGAGDRVVAQVGKSAQAIALYLAVLRIGATYVPLNTDYTAVEVARFVADAEPALLVASQESINAVVPLDQQHCRAAISLEPDGSGELVRRSLSTVPFDSVAATAADDVAAILYTSGTTGRSKGAMLTHENLAFVTRTLCESWEITTSDVLLHALPLFHAHGLFIAAGPALYAGAKIHLLPKFTVEGVLERLPSSTVFMGIPTFYTRLLANSKFDRERCAHVRLFTSGSAPLSAEVFKEFEQRIGYAILERYGLTETTIVSSNPVRGPRLAGTVGYPLPGVDVRVVPSGDGPSDVGELEVRGPNVFKGYWRMPEQTAQEFRDDGFFKTGDIARLADDGRITLVGRAKDMIISGGYNVYPREVEEVLCAAPGIHDAAVVGVPHPDFGEGVIAVAECDPGKDSPTEAQVLTAVAQVLAKYKVPKRLFFVDALPRNAMGKVLKSDLRKFYAAVFSN
ncbi:Long-chain-fatty-acid--CoA ligase [compost metagenome]